MYINKAQIYGNLTRDPEVKALPSGIKVANLSVATNRVWRDKDGSKKEAVEYHNVVVFGKQAELVDQYMRKGNPIFIEGRLQTRSWDATDGSKKYRTEIIAENFQFGPKGGTSTGGNFESKGQSDSSAKGTPKDAPSPSEIQYPEEEINIEDIPF
jgi:single-strand DNA-binding protein